MENERLIGNNYLLKAYTFLFIFTMFNREWQPYGFDFRYIVVLLAIIIILRNCVEKYKTDGTFILTVKFGWIFFYIYTLGSSINWVWNGLEIDQHRFLNEIILLVNVLLAFMVFTANKYNLEGSFITNCVVLSGLFLGLSMILVFLGVPLETIGGNDEYAGFFVGNGIDSTHINIFGMNIRVAGYAEDANYASILILIAFISVLRLRSIPVFKIFISIYFLIVFGLAFSKTVVLAIILAVVAVILKKVFDIYVDKKSLYVLFLFAVVMGISIYAVRSDFFREFLPNTLTIRIRLWERAEQLFYRNPIFGNGITSFRSYNSKFFGWYVHDHNTYWQLLSELGIVGFILYIKNAYSAINNSRNNLQWFASFVYLFWIVSYESIALQFSVYFFIIQFIQDDDFVEGSLRQCVNEGMNYEIVNNLHSCI